MNNNESEPISLGIIVNFRRQTVEGLTITSEPTAIAPSTPLPITVQNATIIGFYNRYGSDGSISETKGSISRVTGVLSATELFAKQTDKRPLLWRKYFLKCRPAQQMF